jgi:hypothetical protein
MPRDAPVMTANGGVWSLSIRYPLSFSRQTSCLPYFGNSEIGKEKSLVQHSASLSLYPKGQIPENIKKEGGFAE